MATVLFVCLRNAGRSQMSAAMFDRAAAGRHRALSAGTLADPGAPGSSSRSRAAVLSSVYPSA
jgi:protein-tyrosine-phosphatase